MLFVENGVILFADHASISAALSTVYTTIKMACGIGTWWCTRVFVNCSACVRFYNEIKDADLNKFMWHDHAIIILIKKEYCRVKIP